MKQINDYINEKLVINKDSIDNYIDNERYTLEFYSFNDDIDYMKKDIRDKTNIKKFELNINANSKDKYRSKNLFILTLYSEKDYLMALMYLLNRFSGRADQFDIYMEHILKDYNNTYKDKIHKLFSYTDILDAWDEYKSSIK